MSEPTPKPTPKPDHPLTRLRVPAVLLACLLMVGAYYMLHYRTNAEYLASRNFRLLATLGEQVKEAVTNEGIFLSNVAELSVPDKAALSPRIKVSNCAAPEERPPDQVALKGALKLWRTLDSADGAYRLSFKSERLLKEKKGVLSGCDAVELKDLLDPLFSSRQAFDAVLLANSAGKVVFLHGPKSLRVEQLDLLIQNRHDTKVAPPKGKEDKNNDFNAFQGYSGSAEVELGGRIYTIFVQPFSLQLADETPREVWLLAGLVAKDKLTTKSLALSPSSVAFLLGILLLAALAWPLAKLKMLGERQRVKKTDVLLAGVCSLLGVSVATMFLLDFGINRTLKSSADMQLKDFAEQMESNLLVEVRLAYDQLLDFESRKDKGHSLTYPYFESFALIDGKGQQVFKLPSGSKFPLINVAERLYFQQVRQGKTLSVPEPEGAEARPAGEPFYLEAVQSWTSGERQAVIANPVAAQSEPPAQVGALSIQMLSMIDPVLPPGFEFAVVGDDGTVLFHSDAARNRVEDFFEETEQDRRFHSIVLARHDEAFSVHYWGESYRAYAIPVKGLPWTIVAMRNEQVLEKVNLDWLVTTLILVLIYFAFVLVLTAAIFLRPGNRAVWIWPDRDRRDEYAKLIAIFAVLCMAFLIALFGLRGTGFLFGVAGLLPVLSLVAAYLKLNQAGSRTVGKRAVEACGVLLLILLGLTLSMAPLEYGSGLWVRWSVLALAVCAFLLAADGPRRWRELQAGARMSISHSFPVLGLLLLLLAAVLPTAGFFKIAHRLQMNSFVRNGQLSMAKNLYERVAALKSRDDPASAVSKLTVARGLGDEHLATFTRRSKPSLDFYGSAFFSTTLSLPGRCRGGQEELEPLAVLLPPYSDYTAQSREMLHSHSSDDDWEWCELKEGETLFDGESYLGISLASKVEPAWRGNGPLLATVGLLLPAEKTDLMQKTNRSPVVPQPKEGSFGKEQVLRVLLALCVLSLSLSLLYALVIFVARRIFLLDLQEPRWAGRAGVLPARVGANVLLISRTKSWPIQDRESFSRMSFRDVGEDENDWPARRLELLRSPDSNVLVEGFEHRAFDPAWRSRKLAILEDLVFVHQRAVVVLSELSPAVLLSPAGIPADPAEDRWRTLLASFTQIDVDVWPPPERQSGAAGPHLALWHEIWNILHIRRPGRRSGVEKPNDGFSSEVLRQECGKDPFLNRIGHELEELGLPDTREQVLEELSERAHGYYGAIWASCSDDERVVLSHLAEEGLVNAKNRRVVRRLMARGLILRTPNFRLMSETFRRFVVSRVCRKQVLELEHKAGPSTWDRFHWPFSAALAACAVLILVTQQELLDSTVAAVTGITAGLPALLKLFDQLGWKLGAKST